MSPGSNRKKPVCQKCGLLMVGHKRPFGIPVCPRDESAPPSSPSDVKPWPSAEAPPDSPTPTVRLSITPTAAPSSKTRASVSPDFLFNPTASGYWHRTNPNWVDPDAHTREPNPLDTLPQRRASWISTERDDVSTGRPPRRQILPVPVAQEVIDVDAEDQWTARRPSFRGTQETEGAEEEENTSDTQSNVSTTSSVTILKRMTRGLSRAIGRSTPLASLYSSPRDGVTAITSAAEAEGLYTRVVHHTLREHERTEYRGDVKAEPATPVRTALGREHSWWVAVGRDRGAVDALVEASTPRSLGREPVVEPYDYDRGLDGERNERVGAYPEDPRAIRNTFLDVLVAGAVGGLVVFYCLSAA